VEAAADTLARLGQWVVRVPHHADDLPAAAAAAAAAPVSTTAHGDAAAEDVGVPPAYPEPTLVVNTASLRVWHRHDNRFRLPKAYLEVRWQHPAALAMGQDHRDVACMRLYFAVLAELLRPVVYDASAAGLSGDVDASNDDGNALVLRVSGYHHTVPDVARALASRLRIPEVTPEVARAFDRVQDATVRALANRAQAQARSRAELAAGKLLRSHAHTDAAQLALYRSLTVADMVAWGARVLTPHSLARARVTALAYGNLTAAEGTALAQAVVEEVRRAVSSDDGGAGGSAGEDAAVLDAALASFPFTTTPATPAGRTLVLTERHPNPVERNCAVHIVWSVGAGTVRNRALTSLLSSVLSHYAFDTLRTKQQLGYVVTSGEGGGASCLYLHMTVQSNTASVAHVQARMEAFVAEFSDQLQRMPAGELEERKAALRARLVEPHKTPGAEFSWLSGRVMGNPAPANAVAAASPDFHRASAIAAAVGALTLGDVVTAYQHIFASAATSKVVSRVYSQPAPTPPAEATGSPVTVIDGGPSTVPAEPPSLFAAGAESAAIVSVGGTGDGEEWLAAWQRAVDGGAAGMRWLPPLHRLATTDGWRADVRRR
jgi:secreted Zn-dependent insulinase-like peptidase